MRNEVKLEQECDQAGKVLSDQRALGLILFLFNNSSRTNGGLNRLALVIKHFEKQKPRPAVDTMPDILRVDSPGSLLVHLSSRVDQWTLVHRPSYVFWVKTPHWAPTFALKDRGVVFENYACTCSIQINE
ncbi:hypothetical protein K438DRAFT_1777287 [Mycena galopus ATCC 62051]|nr:hypothetical protein K438DRAFT_1777287 [Mycena galopus ATCC 62051]